MRIFEASTAPNPRRVRMFLAEKGIEMEYVQVDLLKGENISPQFREKNPIAKVPVLELDDGSYLSESMAICRYFEALQPEPALMGKTPQQQAVIEMWQRRCELYFMNAVGMCFQHSTGYFADRMKPVKEWGDECYTGAAKFMHLLNKHLANSTYIAGESFSVADITAFVTVDFARVIKLKMNEEYTHLRRWYDLINARPSARA
ncbi:MAG: glutathione S-transferase [Oceanospirillaceae bacterium]|nr:glutathione S-transferase [Oceanospirillaceae bacterium]MCP5334167.1 glutathione S-transferase [Oceanospirillaceae bacterium]MCP5351475.1 glutathione S-transferase [Oceanospirillaceae bacterium]